MLTNGHNRTDTELRRALLLSLFHLVLLAVFVFVAFGSSLGHEFVWDDQGLIVDNEQVQETGQWFSSFYRNFWMLGENIIDPTRSFYRPLISLSYTLDYARVGLVARGFHLTNLIAHLLVAWIGYFVAVRLLGDRMLAFLGVALFAVHPTHVENVVWISGRTDVFCGLFYLLAFLFFLKWVGDPKKRSRYALLMTMSYLFSLLSKEMALTFPMIVCLYAVLMPNEKRGWRDFAYILVLLGLITAFYLFQRVLVLGRIVGPATFGHPLQRILSIPMVFVKYMGLLINALPIDPHHSDELLPAGLSWAAIVYSLLALGYAALLYWGYVHGHRKKVFLFAWVPVALLPVFKLGAFGDVLLADRFLYIPSFGLAVGILAIAASSPVAQRGRSTVLRVVGFAIWALVLTSMIAGSRLHASYWAKDLFLFRRAAITSPRSAYVYFNLGNSLSRDQKYEEALDAYLRAIALHPEYLQAYTNVGSILNKLGRHEEALAALDRAMGLNDDTHVLYSNRAHAFRGLGQVDAAIANYRRALKGRETAAVHNNLGECLLAAGYPDQAYGEFLAAIEIESTAASYNNIGLLLIDQEQYEEALPFLEKALSLISGESSLSEVGAIHYNLARVYREIGRDADAVKHARYALNVITSSGAVDERMLSDLHSISRSQ